MLWSFTVKDKWINNYKGMKFQKSLIRIKRLFNGRASVRDYILEKAKKSDTAIILECNGEQMILQPQEFSKGIRTLNKKFVSKWDNRAYYLVDFDWEPNSQLKLL